MTNKITIHRGLTELKTLEDRIWNAIRNGEYITANKKSNKKINGETIDKHRDSIRASYDKVEALIERRNKVKAAIVKSNAITKVTVAGVEMSVAEAIERQSSIQNEKNFLAEMRSQYARQTKAVDDNNAELENRLERYLTSVLGSKEDRNKDEIEAHTKIFLDRNTYELVDPIGLRKKIDELEDYINDFETDVNSVLSESNATTFIFEDEE
ncbi:hypothetical protein [Oceanobacillus oncorhynchi]|uniref:hypothetical protein n=1 Tax=Oceanobacillus oncorhynchi TaxID=545501 RepID=UPI0034D3DCEC